ncbi:MAG: hypothetical protein GF416_07055 [Candidatus Altiarchaeales archaeon]|nr:hypothetical protein [Candidatus Altiarchaeales archaeon]MBD3416871.1 hypothetical protein [Candidatus Altiarchaeales archaeon]
MKVLRSLKDLEGHVMEAKDGEVRSVDDFLFDDLAWTVRYLVANTGEWLPERQVLISPVALGKPPKGGVVPEEAACESHEGADREEPKHRGG